jgi:hypothetical protein
VDKVGWSRAYSPPERIRVRVRVSVRVRVRVRGLRTRFVGVRTGQDYETRA